MKTVNVKELYEYLGTLVEQGNGDMKVATYCAEPDTVEPCGLPKEVECITDGDDDYREAWFYNEDNEPTETILLFK